MSARGPYGGRVPHPVRHLVPLENENGWCDLLAVLIESDPAPVSTLLGLGPVTADRVSVRRETTIDRRDRIDLLIDVDGVLRTAVEAKVLSGLGRDQLARYRHAWPDARQHVLLTPQDFPIQLDARAEGWQPLAWETLLRALSGSANDWVAQTAKAWLAHIEQTLPRLHGGVRWNDLQPGDPWVLNMRARMAWVFAQLNPPAPIVADLVSSSAGNSWVARMRVATGAPGYNVVAEAEETTPVRVVPKIVSDGGRRPLGPTILICLQQTGVDTSSDFHWDWLHAMWSHMADSGLPWHRGRPGLPTPHDKSNQQRIVAAGAPPFLGYGYGDRQTRRSRACMFGAQVRLPAEITLAEVADALAGVSQLILAMADTPPPSR